MAIQGSTIDHAGQPAMPRRQRTEKPLRSPRGRRRPAVTHSVARPASPLSAPRRRPSHFPPGNPAVRPGPHERRGLRPGLIAGQGTRPRLERAAMPLISLEEGHVGHDVVSQELLIFGVALCEFIYAPPGAAVDVELVGCRFRRSQVVQRDNHVMMGVAVDDEVGGAARECVLGNLGKESGDTLPVSS